jgi:tripartite-type tricarboxylate transporter receptor subunit TctC
MQQPNLTRRALALAPAALVLGSNAHAQVAGRPITIVVPFTAGGSTDLVSRVVAQFAAPVVGNPMIVDNRVGGGGVVGWSSAARSAPDGNTLCTIELSYAIAAGLLPNLPFDPHKAFTQVTTAVKVQHVLVVNPAVPAKTVKELIALAKASPGKLNYGSGGNGTNTHLGGELFKNLTGTSMVHIPYKGAGAVLADLMAGQVQVLVTSIPTALQAIRSGRLRALMVTGPTRNPTLPDVPSATEAGLPKMDMDFWIGFGAPAGTPQSVLDHLNKSISESLALPDAKKRIDEMGLTVVGSSPAAATALVNREIDRWTAIIKQAGIKPD